MKQKSKKIILLFIISLVMILGFATMVNAADDEFKINETKSDIVLNGTKMLFAQNAGFETVTWTSSNDSVATVSSNGEVTGKAIGNATITATAGSKTATCTVNVVYWREAKASCDDVVLVIGEYENKTVTITARDYNLKEINNPEVQWKSNDEGIAKVDSNGKITAVKAGTTKVIATLAGATKEINVTITNAPVFTDFSNAKYEITTGTVCSVMLNIKNVNMKNGFNYYYCVTPTNEKPTIELDTDGSIKFEQTKWKSMSGTQNIQNIAEYVQYNQDLYLWICECVELDKWYKNDNDKSVGYCSKYVVAGQKLEEYKYPVYAETFSATFLSDDTSQIIFNLPYDGTERKFTLKIGKITDKDILNGIKNNKGEAWNSLLEYAKKSNAIYNNNLTTSTKDSFASYESNSTHEKRDVIKLNNIENKAYYYMYVVFDDENGKFHPASGLTIAKGWIITEGVNKGRWALHFLGSDDFKWDDFGTIQTGTATVDGNTTGTTKPKSLPKTGSVAIGLVIVAMVGTAVFFKVKNNEYKGI